MDIDYMIEHSQVKYKVDTSNNLSHVRTYVSAYCYNLTELLQYSKHEL